MHVPRLAVRGRQDRDRRRSAASGEHRWITVWRPARWPRAEELDPKTCLRARDPTARSPVAPLAGPGDPSLASGAAARVRELLTGGLVVDDDANSRCTRSSTLVGAGHFQRAGASAPRRPSMTRRMCSGPERRDVQSARARHGMIIGGQDQQPAPARRQTPQPQLRRVNADGGSGSAATSWGSRRVWLACN